MGYLPSMKTIGLLGGMTWHSTATYYDRINRGVAAALGPYRSARIVLHSFDYGEIRRCRQDNDWGRLRDQLVAAARGLRRAGADGLFLCSNTMHRFAPSLESQLSLPLVHIADCVADRALADGLEEVALFGTGYTMTQPFYRERLEARGLRVRVPEAVDDLDRIILEELARGEVRDASRETFLDAMGALRARGAQAMVLACTEIGMLVKPEHVPVPLLDTTLVHADAAVAWALGSP